MIVIPMAGQSSRFAEAGYMLPKYMLWAHGRTLFAHAINSFAKSFQTVPFVFICRDIANTPDFVASQCEELGIRSFCCIVLDQPTSGQAETVALGLEKSGCSDNEAITIFNIDTFRPGFEFPNTAKADGYLEVFKGGGENWSYVRPKGPYSNLVAETAEKIQISDLCCTGLYHFANASLYHSAYRESLNSEIKIHRQKETYVAPIYNILIRKGADIRYHIIKRHEVFFCGVPSEYKDFLKKGFSID